MKTIFEHFMELPEPYRTEAIENTEPEELNSPATNLSSALHGAFYWRDSKQGFDFWNKVWKKYIMNRHDTI
jgi:uncharacterized protein (DUF2249 family)